MNDPLRDVELQQIESRAQLAALALGDPEVARRFATLAATQDVPRLVAEVRRLVAQRGGVFGEEIRELVRDRIVSAQAVGQDVEGGRKIALHDLVRIHSLSVHTSPGQAVVDVRLVMGGDNGG